MPAELPHRRAVFLDRDGVLNRNVWYPDTGAWESPRRPAEFVLVEGVIEALAALRDAGFLLFIVSNQPNEAKGKSLPGTLAATHALLVEQLASGGVVLDGAFYCTHHPEFTGPCGCRKPSPDFLLRAALAHSLHLPECWMVGDRATDMECGRAAGVGTAWIRTGQEAGVPDPTLIDVQSDCLSEAVRQLLTSGRQRPVLACAQR